MDSAIDHIIARALTEPVIGPDGILAALGLIPLAADDRAAQRQAFTFHRKPYDFSWLTGWVSTAVSGVRSLFNPNGWTEDGGDTDDTMNFTKLMDLAGYKTQELQTSVSLIPSAGMTFGIVREMSEGDQDYVDRKLAQDAHVRLGRVPELQRGIVRSVLDVSETAGYEISRVEIEILPLPSVKLVMAPSDAPISMETTSILRAIERLNDRVSEMSQ
jgi:hypothetical protein